MKHLSTLVVLAAVHVWVPQAEGKIATLRERVPPAAEVKEVGTRPFNWALGLQATTPFGAWFVRNNGGFKITPNIFNQLQIGSAATVEFPTKLDAPRWALGVSGTFGKWHTKGFDIRLTSAGMWVSSPRLIKWALVEGQFTPRFIIDYQGTGFDVWRSGMARKGSAHFFWAGGEMRLHLPKLASWWIATSLAFPFFTRMTVEGYKDAALPNKPNLEPLTYDGLAGLRLQLTTGIGLFGYLRTRLGLSYVVLARQEITVQQLQPSLQLGIEF